MLISISIFVFLCSALAILEKHVEEKVHFFKFLDYLKNFCVSLLCFSNLGKKNFLDNVKHFCVSLLCFSNFGKTCGGESAFLKFFGLCQAFLCFSALF